MLSTKEYIEEVERELKHKLASGYFTDDSNSKDISWGKMKRFVHQAIAIRDSSWREAIQEFTRAAINLTWSELMTHAYDNTIKGEHGPFDVTDQDWGNASFTVGEFEKKVIARITQLIKP